jgi:hypothetical protein
LLPTRSHSIERSLWLNFIMVVLGFEVHYYLVEHSRTLVIGQLQIFSFQLPSFNSSLVFALVFCPVDDKWSQLSLIHPPWGITSSCIFWRSRSRDSTFQFRSCLCGVWVIIIVCGLVWKHKIGFGKIRILLNPWTPQ